MIARLYHAPMHSADEEALGCSTVGSSEAIILATLAMKRRWQNDRKAKGLPYDNPNLVLGANCQVACTKLFVTWRLNLVKFLVLKNCFTWILTRQLSLWMKIPLVYVLF